MLDSVTPFARITNLSCEHRKLQVRTLCTKFTCKIILQQLYLVPHIYTWHYHKIIKKKYDKIKIKLK